MGTFMSKLSLYDIFSMLIPGGIIMFAFLINIECLHSFLLTYINGHETFVVVLFLGPIAYIIGIGNHILTHWTWSFFKNYPILLMDCLKSEIKQFDKATILQEIYTSCIKNSNKAELSSTDDYIGFTFVAILALISISSIGGIIVSIDSIGYFYIVLSTLFIILSLCTIRYWNNGDIIYAKIIKNEYYKAYYYIQQKSKNTDISVIEGQVAFLQSMLLPLALMIILPKLIPCSYGVIRLVLFIIFLIIFPIIYNRIRKIHSRVWEDYNFLHDQSNIKKYEKATCFIYSCIYFAHMRFLW